MAFVDEPSAYSEKAIFGVIVSGLAYFLWSYTPLPEWIGRQRHSPASVEHLLLSNPEGGRAFAELKRRYPANYQAMITSFSDNLRAGMPEQSAELQFANGMQGFWREKAKFFLSAPDAELRAIARKEADLLSAAQRIDPSLCALLATDIHSAFRSGQVDGGLKALLAQYGQLKIAAIASGEFTPVAARSNTPDAATQYALGVKVGQTGLSAEVLRMLFQGDLRLATPAQSCEVAVAEARATLDLSPEQTSELIASARAMEASAQAPIASPIP